LPFDRDRIIVNWLQSAQDRYSHFLLFIIIFFKPVNVVIIYKLRFNYVESNITMDIKKICITANHETIEFSCWIHSSIRYNRRIFSLIYFSNPVPKWEILSPHLIIKPLTKTKVPRGQALSFLVPKKFVKFKEVRFSRNRIIFPTINKVNNDTSEE